MAINLGQSGTKLITADGELLGAGDRIRINTLHIICGAGGNGVVLLKSGGSGGTVWVSETGTASKGVTFSYGESGIVLPNGCYVDIDANVVSVAITCYKEIK